MRVVGSAVLSVILWWLAAAAPALPGVVAPIALGASPFVEASGTSLTRDGQPFQIRGAAIYETSNPHNPADDHTTEVLDWAVAGHLNTVRLVNMFVEDGTDDAAPYRESDWARVDQLLKEIGDRGLVAVLDLSAFRNHLIRRDIRVSGHTTDCQSGHVRPPGTYDATDPYRAGAAAEWQSFIDFVTSRVNTVTGTAYRDDPTIAVISLAGEPEPPNTEECGKATTTADLTDFYERTLAMLRVADPNHLHSSGGLWKTDWEHQCDGCGGSGLDGHAIFALADNTLPAIHTYPWKFEPNGTPIDFQSPDLGVYAASLGKPWFTEEFGWTQDVGDAKRASHFTWMFAQQEAYGSAGAMFWNLGPEVAGGSHDVNPGTPLTWNEVRGPIGAWTPAGSIGQHHVFMPAVTLPGRAGADGRRPGLAHRRHQRRAALRSIDRRLECRRTADRAEKPGNRHLARRWDGARHRRDHDGPAVPLRREVDRDLRPRHERLDGGSGHGDPSLGPDSDEARRWPRPDRRWAL